VCEGIGNTTFFLCVYSSIHSIDPLDLCPVIQVPSELHLNQADPSIESIAVNPMMSVAGEKRNAASASR